MVIEEVLISEDAHITLLRPLLPMTVMTKTIITALALLHYYRYSRTGWCTGDSSGGGAVLTSHADADLHDFVHVVSIIVKLEDD